MPETAVESLRCGKQPQVKPQHEKGKQPGELCPPPAPPASPSPPLVDSVSQSASGSQIIPLVAGSTLVASIAQQSLVQQYWADVESIGQKQFRPSVLRQTTSRRHHENGVSQATSVCKAEAATGHRPLSPSPPSGSSPRQPQHSLPLREDSPKQSSMEARLHNGSQGSASVLFARGLCRWPGCNAASEDFSSFLKHLRSEHSHGERSIAQWRVQQDMVQYLESQLILEKQKLFAMQLHLHLSEHKYTYLKTASDWPHSLPLLLPQPQAADGDGVSRWAAKHPEEFAQHGYWAAGTAHLLPDLVPSIECYKNHNIRPPYTYAYLIRWSILESPDKQRTLNEIYNWFTTMFFYFRYNTATWKNAVRHNLSLHKCFVRVEGGKGAVWTVDETEYQRRKGQKFHRDCPVKWLTSYSHFCPEES